MKNKSLKPFLMLLLFLGGGYVVGYFIGKAELLGAIVPEKSDLDILVWIGLLISLPLVIGIHELGHLICGLVQGFRFEMFILGFLGIRRNEADRVALFLNTDAGTFGGAAGTSPRADSQRVPEKMANILLAGPLVSLLFALCCFILMSVSSQPFKFLLFINGLISALIFLATTLPARTGIFYTDRKRYQRLRRPGLAQDIEMALLQAHQLLQKKSSLKEMQEAQLLKITQDDSVLFQYMGYYYLYMYHSGDADRQMQIRAEMQGLLPDLPSKLIDPIEKMLAKEPQEF